MNLKVRHGYTELVVVFRLAWELDTNTTIFHVLVIEELAGKFNSHVFFVFFALFICSYSVGGAISILEFYFTHFLYVCLGKITVGLGTASVNLFIALNQLSGLSGGFQADKIFGTIS